MAPTSLRWAALAVFFVVGIPGMIVSSIRDNNGAAATFGLLAAVAALVLLAVTAATTGRLDPDDGYGERGGSVDAKGRSGEQLEGRIAGLVAAGADEAEVRALVGDAVRFGRQRSGQP